MLVSFEKQNYANLGFVDEKEDKQNIPQKCNFTLFVIGRKRKIKFTFCLINWSSCCKFRHENVDKAQLTSVILLLHITWLCCITEFHCTKWERYTTKGPSLEAHFQTSKTICVVEIKAVSWNIRTWSWISTKWQQEKQEVTTTCTIQYKHRLKSMTRVTSQSWRPKIITTKSIVMATMPQGLLK